jgi:hypothetical protein
MKARRNPAGPFLKQHRAPCRTREGPLATGVEGWTQAVVLSASRPSFAARLREVRPAAVLLGIVAMVLVAWRRKPPRKPGA